ncbi:hypothetical protein ACM614_26700, partial [Streptomyces sp. 12297]
GSPGRSDVPARYPTPKPIAAKKSPTHAKTVQNASPRTVPVRYLAHRPQQAVALGPVAPGLRIGTVLGLAFCTVFACVGLFFAAIGFGVGYLAGTSDLPGDPDEVFTETVTRP